MKMMKIGGQEMGTIQITKAKDSKEKKDKKIKTITIFCYIITFKWLYICQINRSNNN